jgi:osmoprotectant transport system ATP-binding protein
MIEVRNVSKSFGAAPVVTDLSFTVQGGEKLVLLGTSGSGKTTTLKMLNRLLEPDRGTIRINGVNVRAQSPQTLRRGIGYVIQQGGLFPHYSVFENIAVVPRLLGWAESRIRERVEHLLTVIGLPPAQFAAMRPAQLSGGQVQRVGLARALAANPPVILMDEPFGALDPITRSRIRQEVSQLAEWREKTIVLVTHDVTEAFGLADRIALMDRGAIGQIDAPQRLLLYPANDFVRRFFDHQRLQLTWMTRLVAEFLPGLTRLPNGPADAPVVDVGGSLWELLEKVQGNASDLIGIRDRESLAYVHREALLTAAVRSV